MMTENLGGCLFQVYESYHTIEKKQECIRSKVLVYCKYQSLSLAMEADQKKAIQLQPVTVDFISPSGVSLYSVRWTDGIAFQVRDWLSIGTFVLFLFSVFRCKNLSCYLCYGFIQSCWRVAWALIFPTKVNITARRIYIAYSGALTIALFDGLFILWSLVHTCRTNQGFSPSGVCEWILNTLKYWINIRLLLYSMEFTEWHRPEEAIPDSYKKCEPGLTNKINKY